MIYLFILLIRYLAVMTYDLFIYSINQIFNMIYLFILLIRYLAVMTYDLFIYSINQIFSSNDL